MKKVVFIVLMLLTNLVLAQYIQNVGMIDAATGNLVYTISTNGYTNPPPNGDWTGYNWSGFTGTTSNGGGLSGGYAPGWNSTTGTFMFGYNQGTIHYSTPVNYALAMAGTNIQVNGFKYSWEYFNQDFSRGTLTGNINLTNSSGQVVQNYNYNMPYTTNGWTLMSGKENFNTQYAVSTLGNLNVSFTGKDDRWWAGYYGPQIRAIDVSLLYSVAPPPVQTDFAKWVPLTNENGEFTLATAGVVRYGANGTYVYANFQPGTYSCSNGAWGIDPLGGVGKACDFGTNTTTTPTTTIPKTTTTTTDYTTSVALLDPVTTTTTTSDPVSTTTTSPTTTVVDTTTSTTPTTSTATQTGTVSVVSAPAPATTSTSTTTASSSSSSSSSSSTTQSSTKESSGSSGGSNVGLALSVIGKNSDRDAAGSAVAQSAMAQAQSAATQAQQEAASVASSAVSNSMTANAVTAGSQQSNGSGIKTNSNSNSTNFTLQSGQTALASISGPQSTQTMFVQQQGSGTTSVNVSTGQQVSTVNTIQQSTNNTSTSIVALLQPQQSVMMPPIMTISSEQQLPQQTMLQNSGMSTQIVETYSLVTPNMLTDKSNPLTDIVEGKQTIPQNNTTTTTGPAVNKNAQDNEIAGGVDINKMALSPTGYGDYLNFTLRDVAFYAPKEVYRNQRNVDNARALRSLTNDGKHQQMVEQQYRR